MKKITANNTLDIGPTEAYVLKKAELNYEPDVSVIVSVYNASRYLRQALDCIISQTLKTIEIICVDDVSTDDSLDILKEYAQKDSRISVLKNEQNYGAGVSRNVGIAVAQGKYLLFLDSDDFFEPDMCEKMFAKAQKDCSDVVIAAYFFHQDDKDVKTKKHLNSLLKNSPLSPQKLKNNIYSVITSNAWSKLFLSEKVKKHQVFFEHLSSCNDFTFVYVMCSLADQISFMPECFVHYRTNTGTNISSYRGDKAVCVLYALRALYQQLMKFGIYQTFKKAFLKKSLSAVLWELSFCTESQKEGFKAEIHKVLPAEVVKFLSWRFKLQTLFDFKPILRLLRRS